MKKNGDDMMIERMISVNGINMYLKENVNKGDTIVFLHCSSGNREQWNAIIDFFKDDYHLVIPDLRGHGLSSKPLFDYTLEAFATDIKDMMIHLEIESAHFVGSSLGGEIAVAFAAIHPHLVKSLVCEGAIANNFGPNSFYGDLSEEEINIKKDEITSTRAKLTSPIFKSSREMIDSKKADYERSGLQWNDYRKMFVEANILQTKDMHYMSICPTHVGLELTKVYFDIKFEDYFTKITCPILFLPSEDESNCKVEMDALNTYKPLLKDMVVKVIKGSVHAQVMFDEPKQFSDSILSFYQNI